MSSDQTSTDSVVATEILSTVEARIVGCLVEKEATTPDAYPLTLNSLVVACNQKTSRDPLMMLNAGDVEQALRRMEVRGLVRAQHTARAGRYSHRMEAVLNLTRQQTALIALLMLRGPQTLHELLSRSERWVRFEGIDDVQHVLERLSEREVPFAVRLPRGGGQREDRYAHLLSGTPVVSDTSSTPSRAAPVTDDTLRDRIDALEARITSLEARFERFA